MPTQTKDRIVGASAELFRRQGYTATGVKQIVAEAQRALRLALPLLPGGKEQLGAETIRWSGELYGALIPAIFDPAPDVVTAVRDFFAGAARDLAASDYADACPIATVALEVSSTSEPLREACADVFDGWLAAATERFAGAGIAERRRPRAGDRHDRGARGRLRPRPRPAQHRAADCGRRADGRRRAARRTGLTATASRRRPLRRPAR